jgi:hypothetical protein
MLLRQVLESGDAGLRWDPPASFDWRQEDRRVGVALDPDRRVTWIVRILPWPFDLRPAFADVLRRDIEAEARHAFEAAHEAAEGGEWPPGSGQRPRARTEDPAWSPVVECERVPLGAAPALRLVRRLTYRPGDESLSGALLVPLQDGFAEIAAIARAGQTGYRESILMLLEDKGSRDPERPFPKQAVYDDPGHDAQFADHPLSLVRAALRWLTEESGLVVTGPMEEPPVGEVHLAPAQCVIVPPPRYIPVSQDLLPMAPTLANCVRSVFGTADPRLLGVWRTGDRIDGADRAAKLRRLASETTAAWSEEGAADIVQETRIVAGDGRLAAVQNIVRFSVSGTPKLSAQRWRVDEDGAVFRVSADGPGHLEEAALLAEAGAVMESLRRTDTPSGAPTPPARPWWKLW